MIEEWKDVKGYEGLYQISNLGNIKSLNYRKTKKAKILKKTIGTEGYFGVILSKYGQHKRKLIHRLVAQAFIENPEGKKQIDHIDTDRLNNNYQNLRWATPKENNSNPLTTKKMSEAKDKKKVFCIEYNRVFNSARDAQRELGIDQSNISKACRGIFKTSGGLHWKFI